MFVVWNIDVPGASRAKGSVRFNKAAACSDAGNVASVQPEEKHLLRPPPPAVPVVGQPERIA